MGEIGSGPNLPIHDEILDLNSSSSLSSYA